MEYIQMKTIVITSIFPPTQAVHSFSNKKDYSLVVVGDKKSPNDWHLDGVHYLGIEKQAQNQFKLVQRLPYNHYCRKMIGYLFAIKEGASTIIDTDDDNYPKAAWAFPDFEGSFDLISGVDGYINVYSLFTGHKIWPRGLPLNAIALQDDLEALIQKQFCNVGIWQGLADGDPDVDAIYRLTNNTPCFFQERSPVVLDRGVVSPFNSQNTAFCKELFPLLYLPTSVSFRFTDILRGFVAQPIMWSRDYLLGFTEATVVQERNNHDLMEDFRLEIPMYDSCESLVPIVSQVVRKDASISDNLLAAYAELIRCEIVASSEMQILDAWLDDLAKISSSVS
jgi:hypothetical protein